jgi:HlyD family secretion protein
MNKKLVIGLIILVVVLVAGIELYIHRNFTKGPNFRTEAVQRGDVEANIVTSGTLSPVSMIPVGAQISGKIVKILADFNAKVKKGDVLAVLDEAPFQASVDQRTSNLEAARAALEQARVAADLAKKERDRSVDLFAKAMISVEDEDASIDAWKAAQDEVLVAQAGVKQAQAFLDQARVDLSHCIIRAPIDGVVVYREVNVGQTLASSYQAPELFKIANDVGKLLLDCDVDEADVGRVKEGQDVRFEVEAYPGITFPGKVIQVRAGGETDATGKIVTYHTLVDADNPEGKLLPGMTATASVITASAKNVLFVNNSALKFEPALPAVSKRKAKAAAPTSAAQAAAKVAARRAAPRVWIQKDDGTLASVSVHTGVAGNIYTEISGGDLKEGDVVVLGLEAPTKK